MTLEWSSLYSKVRPWSLSNIEVVVLDWCILGVHYNINSCRMGCLPLLPFISYPYHSRQWEALTSKASSKATEKAQLHPFHC